ncbi:hypothetical protein FOA52_008584 [Chlamydomonas sp. UWO 241]|nr:hypothetical protein FOA52_008584 [Chlamydomonas sp. UWO 241]
MRMQVDAAVTVLACPADADPEEFRRALELRWPGVKHLIMHSSWGLGRMVDAASSTLTLLEKLSFRQVFSWGENPLTLPPFSSQVSATLRVLDIRHCSFGDIGSVRSGGQLTRIQMDRTRISDLAPLADCAQLEERHGDPRGSIIGGAFSSPSPGPSNVALLVTRISAYNYKNKYNCNCGCNYNYDDNCSYNYNCTYSYSYSYSYKYKFSSVL